ncbi:MAG TPA: ABC transporter permease, partial [Mycobacteriales bacterium]|nr:ABC transporter permease [Mycobacteriales bacterium]
GIAVVAVRNSSYGRRLTAMRDSPAAAATLGQNLRRLKLSVFGFSAAIAGLGGILMAGALGSVTADHFSIFVSLALLMLTVVFGVSYVSGALLGGVMSGVGFAVVVSTFQNLQQHHPAFSSPYAWLAHIAAVSPALIGIGLGRSPSGSVTDIVAGYRPLANAKRILVGGAVVEALFYVLSLTHVIGHWTFAMLSIVLVLVLPIFGQMLAPEVYVGEEAVRAHRAKPSLDTIGVDTPFTDDDRVMLDQALGV